MAVVDGVMVAREDLTRLARGLLAAMRHHLDILLLGIPLPPAWLPGAPPLQIRDDQMNGNPGYSLFTDPQNQYAPTCLCLIANLIVTPGNQVLER